MTVTFIFVTSGGSSQSGETGIVKVVFASLIGTAVEWYDFFFYGSAAALIFGKLFFFDVDLVNAILLAFGIYAVGFVARLLGGVVFGHFGDRVGRKRMLVVALTMMGVVIFAIGLFSTYVIIGIAAPILLLVCRLLQGFAVGGEWGGAVLMAVEHGFEARRGYWSSWPQAGVSLGNLLVIGVLFVLVVIQSDADFEAWGWRILFLFSAVLVLIGLYIRLQLEESLVFKEVKAEIVAKKDEFSHMFIVEVIKTYFKEVFIVMGMRMVENISYYIFMIVSIIYVTIYFDQDKSMILKMLLIGAALQFFLVLAIGAFLDRVGRRFLYFIGAVGVGVWGFVFFGLFDINSPGKVLLAVVVGLFFYMLMYVLQAVFFSELFGTSVCYIGAFVGYQLASIFVGALVLIIVVCLLGDVSDKNTFVVGVYVVVAVVIMIVAVVFAKEISGSSLRHDRVVRGAHD